MAGHTDDIHRDAAALSNDALIEFRFDYELVLHNARLGIEAVDERRSVLMSTFKKYVDAGPRLLQLLGALGEAMHEVDATRPVAQGVQKQSEAVYADRGVLMAQLLAWELTGLVPRAEVQLVRDGSGLIDAARDVLAMVRLTEKYPVTKPKLICTDEEIAAMVKRAEALLLVVKRTGSRSKADSAHARARNWQSRIWTLIVQQHELLWKNGVQLFGRDVDTFVPQLGSKASSKQRKAQAGTPDPVTA